MSQRLPDFVDPWGLADAGKRFRGSIPLRELERLCSALAGCDGDVEFEIAFRRDHQRRALIEGSVRASLSLQCQRCLQTMAHAVDSRFQLAVIEVADEVERIPEHCEPVQVEEGQLSPLALIEDELLLSIPQVPKHDPSICRIDPVLIRDDEADQDGLERESTVNPFAVLATLKSDESN